MARRVVKKKKDGRGGPRPNSGGAREGAGRPSEYTSEMGDLICEKLMEGLSLIKVCELPGMPSRVTVVRWLTRYAEFESNYEKARATQADLMDDKILDAANECTQDDANAARVKIMAYQWRAGRLKPRKYGDKSFKEVTGADGGPLKVDVTGLSDAELEALENLVARTTGGPTEGGEGGKG